MRSVSNIGMQQIDVNREGITDRLKKFKCNAEAKKGECLTTRQSLGMAFVNRWTTRSLSECAGEPDRHQKPEPLREAIPAESGSPGNNPLQSFVGKKLPAAHVKHASLKVFQASFKSGAKSSPYSDNFQALEFEGT